MGSFMDYNLAEARRKPLKKRIKIACLMILTALGSPLLVVALFCVLVAAACSLVLCGAGPEDVPDEPRDEAHEDRLDALDAIIAVRQEVDELREEIKA